MQDNLVNVGSININVVDKRIVDERTVDERTVGGRITGVRIVGGRGFGGRGFANEKKIYIPTVCILTRARGKCKEKMGADVMKLHTKDRA